LPEVVRAREPEDRLRDEARRGGTLAPFFRASLNPIAIACFRLRTFRPDPLFSVPFFRRCIADLTVLDADLPYFAMPHLHQECLQTVCWCLPRPSRERTPVRDTEQPRLR
jgi:hypothetical protein